MTARTDRQTAVGQPEVRRDLSLARGAWVLVAVLTLGVVALGLPTLFEQLIGTVDERALEDLGLSLDWYATYLTALNVLFMLAHFVIAGVIFSRRSNDWMALFASFALVTNGALIPLSLMYPPESAAQITYSLAEGITSIGLASGVIILYLFPDGRFVPRWTRWLAISWAAIIFLTLFTPDAPLSLTTLPLAVQFGIVLIHTGAGLFAQIYRYANVSGVVERQQTKWAILGLTLAVSGPFAYFMPFAVLPFIRGPEIPNILYQRVGPALFSYALLFQIAGWTIFTLVLLVFPLSLVIAIMRYRLWDIDVIINRTLVYGALTGNLVIVYFLSVVLLQRFLPAETQVAVVASTLAIAALFNPLRHRIQATIDRRFYRRKYDAEQILQLFNARVRDEVDLDSLSNVLLAVVAEAMQPRHLSLWLKE